jgi:hypothetical protein
MGAQNMEEAQESKKEIEKKTWGTSNVTSSVFSLAMGIAALILQSHDEGKNLELRSNISRLLQRK